MACPVKCHLACGTNDETHKHANLAWAFRDLDDAPKLMRRDCSATDE